jgi:hypothetical protein
MEEGTMTILPGQFKYSVVSKPVASSYDPDTVRPLALAAHSIMNILEVPSTLIGCTFLKGWVDISPHAFIEWGLVNVCTTLR